MRSPTHRVAAVGIARHCGVELRLLRVPVDVKHDVCQRKRVVRIALENLAYELRLRPTSKVGDARGGSERWRKKWLVACLPNLRKCFPVRPPHAICRCRRQRWAAADTGVVLEDCTEVTTSGEEVCSQQWEETIARDLLMFRAI